MVVPYKRQVNAPDVVDTHRRGALAAQFAGDVEQRILVVPDGVADKGFAHPRRGMQAVEGVSHLAATGVLAHQGLDAQDFLHNPFGLLAGRWGKGVNSSRVWGGAPCKALAMLSGEALGQKDQGQERWCHEQNRDQHEEPNEHRQKALDYEGRSSGGISMLWLSRGKYGKVIPPTTLEG